MRHLEAETGKGRAKNVFGAERDAVLGLAKKKRREKGRCRVSGAGFQGRSAVVKSYRDLRGGEAMDLLVESYRLANLLPKNETYGLATQILTGC